MCALKTPPGFEESLVNVESGGSGDWAAFESRKWYTNALVTDPSGTKVSTLHHKSGMEALIDGPRFFSDSRREEWVLACESSCHFCKGMFASDQERHGRYNGFGGKIEPGETPAEAARRELKVCLL